MPTATARNLGKTGFVKEFLNDNPEANTRAVNEAWGAAGFEGTISPTLVTKIRSEMGLTGNVPKGPGKKAEAETGAETSVTSKKRGRTKGATGKSRGRRPEQAPAGANGTTAVLGSRGEPATHSRERAKATGRGGNQGKTAFVTKHLRQHPDATDDEITEAWAAAGNEGGISGSLIYKIRAKEGLTGKRGARGRGAKKKGRAKSLKSVGVDRTAEPLVGTPKPLDRRTNRGRIIDGVEGDIDRLIFKLIALGGMETIEEELRKVRRLLYRRYSV
jgi:hypothetical protein